MLYLRMDVLLDLGLLELILQILVEINGFDQDMAGVHLTILGLTDFDDVVAILSLHELGYLAGLEVKGGIFKRLDHLTLSEESKIPAIGS